MNSSARKMGEYFGGLFFIVCFLFVGLHSPFHGTKVFASGKVSVSEVHYSPDVLFFTEEDIATVKENVVKWAKTVSGVERYKDVDLSLIPKKDYFKTGEEIEGIDFAVDAYVYAISLTKKEKLKEIGDNWHQSFSEIQEKVRGALLENVLSGKEILGTVLDPIETGMVSVFSSTALENQKENIFMPLGKYPPATQLTIEAKGGEFSQWRIASRNNKAVFFIKENPAKIYLNDNWMITAIFKNPPEK